MLPKIVYQNKQKWTQARIFWIINNSAFFSFRKSLAFLKKKYVHEICPDFSIRIRHEFCNNLRKMPTWENGEIFGLLGFAFLFVTFPPLLTKC